MPGVDGYLEWTAPTIAEDLALDEALLVEAEEGRGGPTLRLWEPRSYAIVLGASGRRAEDVRLEAAEADGVPLARRSSGGGTVVVGPGVLNATVVLRVDAAPGLGAVDAAQAFVLGRFAEAIRALGPPAEVLGSGDLALDGRKFAGSAQRRLRGHFLVHVSILNRFDLARIVRYLHAPRRQPAYRAGRPHEAFVANLDLPRDILAEALRGAWRPPGGFRPVERPGCLADRLARERFADPAWVGRL